MPGIITHNKIFRDSLELLKNRKKKSYLLKSVSSLFNTEEFYRAGLFGSIGPNIFDYIPKRDKKNYYGSSISFFLHNGGSANLLEYMIKKIYSFEDKNTEWAAVQRAYLYGLISHIISDSIFHPFIFYWSGFPNTYSKKEVYHYREQNLLFTYNIDNYFLYSEKEKNKLKFDVNQMLPVKKRKRSLILNPGVKNFILESIDEVYPEIYKKIIIKKNKEDKKDYIGSFGYVDLVPYFIKFTYNLKWSKNRQLNKFIRFIKQKGLFFSDYIIKYPDVKQINDHVLNLHMERWVYPCKGSGAHYDSINHLLNQSCEKIVETWENIESSLWEKSNTKVIKDLNINSYTGDKKSDYFDMKEKNPVRLYFKS